MANAAPTSKRRRATVTRNSTGTATTTNPTTTATTQGQDINSATAAAAVLPRYSALKSRSSSAGGEVSVLCWNSLSAALAKQNALPWASVEALSWEQRAPLIQAELRATSPDIICLQEVDGSKFEQMQSWLPGYQSLLQDSSSMKADSAGRKDRMVLAIFYKPRFRLMWADHRSRTLLAHLRDTSSSSSTSTSTSSSARPRDLWLVNMHLEGHPLRPHDRVNQLRSALAKLASRLATTERRHPAHAHLVVCGDLNSGQDGAAHQLIHTGKLAADATEHDIPVTKTDVSHPFPLRDVYQAAGCPMPFTRKAPGLPATIDFIFASSHLDVAAVYHPLVGTRPASAALATASPADASTATTKKLLAACTGRALAQSLQARQAGMPNLLCPSDHLPLGVVLRWPATEDEEEQEEEEQEGGSQRGQEQAQAQLAALAGAGADAGEATPPSSQPPSLSPSHAQLTQLAEQGAASHEEAAAPLALVEQQDNQQLQRIGNGEDEQQQQQQQPSGQAPQTGRGGLGQAGSAS